MIADKKEKYMKLASGVMFTKIQAHQGIKQSGEEAIAALIEELKNRMMEQFRGNLWYN